MLELEKYLAAGTTTVSNLLLNHYYKIGMSHLEFVLYLQLVQHHEKGNDFPDLIVIGQQLGLSNDEVYRLIQSLMEKKIIKLVTTKTAEGKTADAYDLSPVYTVLASYLTSQKQQTVVAQKEEEISALFQLFEQEFGRPLSPIELETIGHWLDDDQYEVEIIRLGLKEAVLNQAYSLKYIDRILLSWERKNMTSKEQILTEQNRRKKSLSEKDKHQGNNQEEDLPTVPLYNWMDPQSK